MHQITTFVLECMYMYICTYLDPARLALAHHLTDPASFNDATHQRVGKWRVGGNLVRGARETTKRIVSKLTALHTTPPPKQNAQLN